MRWQARVLIWLFLMFWLSCADASDGQPHGVPRPADGLALGSGAELGLSPAEQAWLRSLPPLRVGMDPASAPLTLLDRNGKPQGIANDYLQVVAHALGLKLVYVPTSSWKDTLEQVRQGAIDIVPAGSPASPENAALAFSATYVDFPVMIVTQEDAGTITGVADLAGKRVAANVTKQSVRVLANQLSEASIVPVDSTDDGLAKVADGDAEAFIGDIATADFIIRQSYPGRLKIAAPTGERIALAMGVRKPYAALVPLIDRVLAHMPERQQQAIRNTWLSSTYVFGVSWEVIVRRLLPVAAVVLLFLLTISYAYFRLRRETRQRLHSEEQLADVTRNLPAVVYKFRYREGDRVVFEYVGGNPESIFGVSAAVLRTDEARVLATVLQEDRAQLTAAVDEAARSLTPLHARFRVRVDGYVRWVLSHAVPSPGDSGAVYFDGYWVDITEQQHQAEQLALAKEIAETASEARSEFLATMSHEIRTPMSGVIGMLELLGQTPLDNEQRQTLRTAETSASALLQILDDVLDFSRMEAGQLIIEYVPTDLRDLLDGAFAIMSTQAHRKGLRLHIDVDARLAAEVMVDPNRLRQVVLNLLSNAIKFTVLGVVAMRLMVVEEQAGRQRVRISVVDTGIGIAPEQVGKLFAPFTQAESSTTRRYGGTGLGLVISRRLVDLMEGTIRLESVPDRGTGVHVDLELSVRRRDRADGELQGRTARVQLADRDTASALGHFLVALGIRIDNSSCVPDLCFADEPLETTAAYIRVSREPNPHGYTQSDSGVVLTDNPLKWPALAMACRKALGVASDEIAARPTPRPSQRQSELPVLVAEDNPVNQTLIAAQLDRLGYVCDVVSDGRQALEALATGTYAMLITDCHMPVMDGYELARRIRREEATSGRHLPILAMTANALAGEAERCQQAGMDDFLPKPVRIADLEEKLAAARFPDSDTPVAVDLDELRATFGDDSRIRELIGRFVDGTRQDFAALDSLVAERRPADVAHYLHRLLGGLRVFGVSSVATEGEALERAMKSDRAYDALSQVPAFQQRLERWLTQLAESARGL